MENNRSVEDLSVEELQELLEKKKQQQGKEEQEEKVKAFSAQLKESLSAYVGKCFLDTDQWQAHNGRCRMLRFERLEIGMSYGVPYGILFYTSLWLPVFPKFLERYSLQSITPNKIAKAYAKWPTNQAFKGALRQEIHLINRSASHLPVDRWYEEKMYFNYRNEKPDNVYNYLDLEATLLNLRTLEPMDAVLFAEAEATLEEFESMLIDATVGWVTKVASQSKHVKTMTHLLEKRKGVVKERVKSKLEAEGAKNGK